MKDEEDARQTVVAFSGLATTTKLEGDGRSLVLVRAGVCESYENV